MKSKNWAIIIDINADKNLTELKLNGYIVKFIRRHTFRNSRDETLWVEFLGYFDDRTKEYLEIPDHSAIVDLIDFFRRSGMFVFKAPRISIAGKLAKIANEKEQHIWSNKEILDILEKESLFNSQ